MEAYFNCISWGLCLTTKEKERPKNVTITNLQCYFWKEIHVSHVTTVFVKYFLKTDSQLNLHTNENPIWSMHCTYTLQFVHAVHHSWEIASTIHSGTLFILPCTVMDKLYMILYLYVLSTEQSFPFKDELSLFISTSLFQRKVAPHFQMWCKFPYVMQVSIKAAQFLGKLPNWWSFFVWEQMKVTQWRTWICRGYDETKGSHWLSFLIKYGWKRVDRGSNSH